MIKLGSINIYGVEYELFETTNEETRDIAGEDKSKDFFGCHIAFEQRIYINSDLKYENKKRTFIHEVTHAILLVLGYSKKRDEEFMCDFIAAHYELIKDLVQIFYK